ncbi:MAG: sugar transporter substrate-binding protein [Xanthobacteraceae bacterium]|jgi:inositol transport system substrate-binding protein|nr:sugar transporter substrate-binding protein [Xanthobacteraceae bacterium]
MKAGELKVTVFQDAVSQGKGALDTVLKLARGEKTEKKVFTTSNSSPGTVWAIT